MRERRIITPQQRLEQHQQKLERRRQAKEKPAKNYYQVQKYKALRYSKYDKMDEAYREMVQEAALEIHRWQRNTIEMGKTLLSIKEVLPHGQFEDWWHEEFGLSERMVQSLLTVARVYGDPANPRRVAGLSDGALYLLAAPSTPEAARLEVEHLLIEGHAPKRAEVRTIIAAHQPPKMPKRLTGPVEEIIEAEYTVMPSAIVTIAVPRELADKLQAGVLTRIFKAFLTDAERDTLLVALDHALRGE
jgi:hypothetical protein